MNHDIADEGVELDTRTPYVMCSCGAGFRGITRSEALRHWARHVNNVTREPSQFHSPADFDRQ